MNDRSKRQLDQTGLSGNREDDPLAAAAHRALRQIPGRRAPASLAPRILAEIARRSRLAWYRRPWTDWPEALRWFSTLFLAGTVAGALRLLEGPWSYGKVAPTLTAVQDVPVYFDAAESSGRALLLAIQSLPSTWLFAAGCAVALTVAGTLGLTTAAWRLAKSSTH